MASFTPSYSNVRDSTQVVVTPNVAVSALSASAGGIQSPPRQWLMLHNPSTANNLWYNLTNTPVVNGTTGSILLLSGGTHVFENTFCPQDEVKFTGAVTGQALTVKFL